MRGKKKPLEGEPGDRPSVETWRIGGFEGVELHRGSRISLEYPRHWHEEIYFCAILEGAAYLDFSGASTLTPRGSLTIVPAGEIHANRKIGCTFRCVFMEPVPLQDLVERFLETASPGMNFRTTLVDDTRTTQSFLRMHRSLEAPDSRLDRDHSILAFLQKLVVRHSTASVKLPRDGDETSAVHKAKKILDVSYAEQVSLHDLARLTALSPYHLNRSFRRKIGIPPHAYQLQVRIARAKAALRCGSSIAEVALATGFADQSHFTRVFRRLVGRTPGQYSSGLPSPTIR